MAVTMQDLAERLGVTKATVSRVLSGKARQARISPQRERQVLETARAMSYRPNASARATRTGRFGTVALLLSSNEGRSFSPAGMFVGIHDALAEAGLTLSLARVSDDMLHRGRPLPRLLSQHMADGLLVNYTDHIPPALERLIEAQRLPAIWINVKRPSDCVRPDDLAAGRQATELLLARGHRRVAYADYVHPREVLAEAHYSAVDREAGYVEAMRRAGLEPRVLRFDRAGDAQGAAFLARTGAWLSGPDRPTAIVTYGPVEAGAWVVVALQQGLRLGEDLALVTLDVRPHQIAGLTLTTLVTPERRIGDISVRMLQDKLSDGGRAQPPRAVPCTVHEGQSTACKAA